MIYFQVHVYLIMNLHLHLPAPVQCRYAVKVKGHILRVAAAMHALFSWQTPQFIPPAISDEALKAAESFVKMCNQDAAFLAGRGDLTEAIENVQMLQQGI